MMRCIFRKPRFLVSVPCPIAVAIYYSFGMEPILCTALVRPSYRMLVQNQYNTVCPVPLGLVWNGKPCLKQLFAFLNFSLHMTFWH